MSTCLSNLGIGVVSYSFRQILEADLPAGLDQIATMGFKHIELSGLYGVSATQMLRLLQDRGLVCTCLGCSYHDLQARPAAVAEEAATLGAKYARVSWIPLNAPFDLPKATEVAAVFNTAGHIMRYTNQVRFCYHNHGYEFVPHHNGILWDLILAISDPDLVAFEIDVLWAFAHGIDPAAMIARNPTRYELMHLRDLAPGEHVHPQTSQRLYPDTAIGRGLLDIPKILQAVSGSAITHIYLEDESPDYATQLGASLSYLAGLA